MRWGRLDSEPISRFALGLYLLPAELVAQAPPPPEAPPVTIDGSGVECAGAFVVFGVFGTLILVLEGSKRLRRSVGGK